MILTQTQLENIIGRREHDFDFNSLIMPFKNKTVMITGSNGSLGRALLNKFDESQISGITTIGVDITQKSTYVDVCCDITDKEDIRSVVSAWAPDYIFHLAADKHAPVGEVEPNSTYTTDIVGTDNVLSASYEIPYQESKFVLASTCKACNPETVYGASKLIAERLTLNAGGSVARLYNVADSSGNVFEIWNKTKGPLEVTNCDRYFITSDEAVALLLHSATHSGRFVIGDVTPRNMHAVARRLHPNRDVINIPPRRGDRTKEPLLGSSETIWGDSYGRIAEVKNYHD